jgi:hypothetical protein
MIPLVVVALWIGLYPKPVMDKMDKSVAFVMQRLQPAMERVHAANNLTPPHVTKLPDLPKVPVDADAGAQPGH